MRILTTMRQHEEDLQRRSQQTVEARRLGRRYPCIAITEDDLLYAILANVRAMRRAERTLLYQIQANSASLASKYSLYRILETPQAGVGMEFTASSLYQIQANGGTKGSAKFKSKGQLEMGEIKLVVENRGQ